MCVDMCVDMCAGMCAEMCVVTCLGMCLGTVGEISAEADHYDGRHPNTRAVDTPSAVADIDGVTRCRVLEGASRVQGVGVRRFRARQRRLHRMDNKDLPARPLYGPTLCYIDMFTGIVGSRVCRQIYRHVQNCVRTCVEARA